MKRISTALFLSTLFLVLSCGSQGSPQLQDRIVQCLRAHAASQNLNTTGPEAIAALISQEPLAKCISLAYLNEGISPSP